MEFYDNASFDIPIVLFIFKRTEKTVKIISQISKVRPSKLYLISDGGRNAEEWEDVRKCRDAVENGISWKCEIIRDYATENRGVFSQIGLGALRVFQKEKWAIFLEDDNLPEVSFFSYCKELLERYEDNDKVLWICGTNYLESCQFANNADYGFTRCTLPCGWASWSDKFTNTYDQNFSCYSDDVLRRIKKSYNHERLYQQDLRHWKLEMMNKETQGRYSSWDYQMSFSIRTTDMFGVIPKVNLVRNIGVDDSSTHGGKTYNSIMTKRFCGMKSFPLRMPMKHAQQIQSDPIIENELETIIMEPSSLLMKKMIVKVIKTILRIPDDQRIVEFFRNQ